MRRVGEQGPQQNQGLFNAAVIKVAGQVGCLTIVVIFGALIAGLVLDRVLDTRPLFTIIFLVGSMPVSWLGVFQIVNRAKNDLIPPISGKPLSNLEDDDSDRN